MNDLERRDEVTMARLLHEALADRADLADSGVLDRVVDGGIERGQLRRRRRFVFSTASAAAVVAVAVAGVATQSDDDARPARGTEYISESSSPTAIPSPSASSSEPTAPRLPRVAVRAAQIPALVTAVRPGKVVEFRPAGGYINQGATQVAHVQLDGYFVSAGITPATGDPLRRCRSSYPARPSPCTELSDGSVLAHGTDAGPAADGGVRTRSASLFVPGFDIFAMSYNAAEPKDSAVLSTEPLLSFSDLDAIVTSEGWVSES